MFIKIKNSFWSVLPSRKSYYPKTMAWSQHIMRTASLSSRGFDSRDAGEPDFFPSPSPPPLSPSDFERSTYPNWTATPSARMESGHSVVEVTVFGESFFFFFFNWRKIVLQCWVGLCHTTKRISHKYTHASSVLNSLPAPRQAHPSRSSQSTGWAPCVMQHLPTSYLLYTWWYTYVSALWGILLALQGLQLLELYLIFA